MSPVPKKTIQHFTHPHPLFEIHNNDREYLCDGCNTLGIGARYRCNACDYDLHDYCATCPAILSSFMHPHHHLNLVVRKPQATRQNNRICDLCMDEVNGLFYRCKLCDFDLHPICTQLPEQLRHAVHPSHPLRLQPSHPSLCVVCYDVCTSWRYRCGICCVDLHIECVLAPTFSDPCPPLPPPPPPPPPSFDGGYGYVVPPGPVTYDAYHYVVGHASASHGRNNKISKNIFKIVGKLAFGVLTNAVGIPDFSSFT